jgi:hypothetical protein
MAASSPPIWKIFRILCVVVPLALAAQGAYFLFNDYRFLSSATERAVAVVTQTEPGRGVLRFEINGRSIDLRGSSGSAGWGMTFPVRYPPGQPEMARTEGGIHSRIRRAWFFLVVGLVCAALFPWVERYIDRQCRPTVRDGG